MAFSTGGPDGAAGFDIACRCHGTVSMGDGCAPHQSAPLTVSLRTTSAGEEPMGRGGFCRRKSPRGKPKRGGSPGGETLVLCPSSGASRRRSDPRTAWRRNASDLARPFLSSTGRGGFFLFGQAPKRKNRGRKASPFQPWFHLAVPKKCCWLTLVRESSLSSVSPVSERAGIVRRSSLRSASAVSEGAAKAPYPLPPSSFPNQTRFAGL